MQQVPEGTIRISKRTGRQEVFSNGDWVGPPGAPAASGSPRVIGTIPGTPDPYKGEELAGKRRDDERADRKESREMAIQPFQERKARAEAIEAERKLVTGNAQVGNLDIVAKRLNRVQELYNQDLKGGGLSKSVGQLFSTEKMQRFENAARSLSVILKPLIKLPGEGTWTDKDQDTLDRLVPSRFTSDIDNEERINFAKDFIAAKAGQAGATARRVPIEKPRRRAGGFEILGYE